jgi:hypothetical protein
MSATSKALSAREQRFCEGIAAGLKGRAAASQAGFTATPASLDTIACRLLRKVQVKNLIEELRQQQTKATLMSRDRKREILRDIAENPDVSTMARIRAVEIDAKLAGHFAPERVEVETGPRILDSIRERAATVASALDRNAYLRARGTSASKSAGLSRWSSGDSP